MVIEATDHRTQNVILHKIIASCNLTRGLREGIQIMKYGESAVIAHQINVEITAFGKVIAIPLRELPDAGDIVSVYLEIMLFFRGQLVAGRKKRTKGEKEYCLYSFHYSVVFLIIILDSDGVAPHPLSIRG